MVLALVIAAPARPTNISKLLPMRAIGIYKEESWFRIETDTGNRGFGGTVTQALRNMKDTASGIVCLDTVEFLIVTKDTQKEVAELESELRPSVRLCLTATEIGLEETVKYLDAHGGLPTLRTWKNRQELPIISLFGDSVIFLKKVENNA